MNGWTKVIGTVLGTALATAAATYFGGQALAAPSVTGQECAKMLMEVAAACVGCP